MAYKYIGDQEQAFKEAIGGLPTYKRSAAFEYVNALKAIIAEQEQQINHLADRKAAQ